MTRISAFLNYGVPDYLANKLDLQEVTVSIAKKVSQKELVNLYSLSKEEAKILKRFIVRKPILEEITFKLLENNNFTCCVCKGQKGDSYIIHHIKEYSLSRDNSYENLAVLCPNDHDRAHMKGFSLTKALSPNEIAKAKQNWEKIVQDNRNHDARKPKTQKQWDALAKKCVMYIQTYMHKVHRGVLPCDLQISAIFGNDGYNSPIVKEEIKLVRQKLKKNKIRVLAFTVCDENYSWCLFAESNDLKLLSTILWSSYPIGGSNNETQRNIAWLELSSYLEAPLFQYLL